MYTFVAGAGYSGFHIAQRALEHGAVVATRRHGSPLESLISLGVTARELDGELSDPVRAELSSITHLVSCIAPDRHKPLNDPLLNIISPLGRSGLPNLEWIGYLSTIGVYGDYAGEWIDEASKCQSVQLRSIIRREAELAWQQFARSLGIPLSVLRLSGIYGPGRNAIEDALHGRAHMLIKPGQVFNRIHVHDLAEAVLLAAGKHFDGIVNVTDDLPTPPQDVIRFAHDLVRKPHPEAVDFEHAQISDMARSFYSESKRVSNALSKSALELDYSYPTYKVGLSALWDSHRKK